MCCSLSLCVTCQTYVLRVQIWWETFSSLPVLLLWPCIWGSQLNKLRVRAPFQELPQSWVEIQTVPIAVKAIRGFKKYIETFMGLTALWAYLKTYNVCLGTDDDRLESLSFGGSYYFGDEWLEIRGEREHKKIALLPTGSQAVPITATLLDVFLKDSSKHTLRL